MLEALDAAAALGIVVAVPGTLGEYRFGHGLIRETLFAGMPAAVRMSGHRVVGEALETVYRGAIEAHLPELAHHFLCAAPRGDVAKAVDYAEQAAHRALDTLAYEQAAELFSRALEALERMDADIPRRSGLLLGLGTAQSRAGRPASRASFEAAVVAARAIDADDILCRAALGFAPSALTPGYVDEAHVVLLVEALERIGPADDPMRVRLLGALAVALYWSDQVARRAELAGEALAMARRLGDEATLAIALSSAQLATCGPDCTERGVLWLRELFALTERTGETVMSLAARSRYVDVLLELDDLAGADMAIESLERHAHELRDRRAAALVPLHRARRAALEGRLADARVLVEHVAKVAPELPTSTIPLTVDSQGVILTWLQHGGREISEIARAYAANQPAMPAWRAALAAWLADGGRREEARLEFDRLHADDFAAIPRDNLWFGAMAMLTEAIVALELREQAMEVHAQLAPFAGRNVVLPTIACLGPVDLWLGILAARRGPRRAGARASRGRAGARDARRRPPEPHADRAGGGDGARARRRRRGAQRGRPSCSTPPRRRARRWSSRGSGSGRRRCAPSSARADAPVTQSLAGLPAGEATLRRVGDVWTIGYEGRTIHLNDGRGVRLLALLLERPGSEVHSLDLVAAVDGIRR